MTPENPLDLAPQAMEVVEKIGLHYENVYSLPRIGSRVLALLLLVCEPLNMLQLEKTLRVSHASVSTNLRLLAALGYIQKLTYPGDRTTYFKFQPRSRVRVLQERIRHYQELQQVIRYAEGELAPNGEQSAMLDEMLAWADLAIKKNSQFIAEWEEYLRSTR